LTDNVEKQKYLIGNGRKGAADRYPPKCFLQIKKAEAMIDHIREGVGQ
jgi:hypothetical protein